MVGLELQSKDQVALGGFHCCLGCRSLTLIATTYLLFANSLTHFLCLPFIFLLRCVGLNPKTYLFFSFLLDDHGTLYDFGII